MEIASVSQRWDQRPCKSIVVSLVVAVVHGFECERYRTNAPSAELGVLLHLNEGGALNCTSTDTAFVVRSTCEATCYRHVIGAVILLTDLIQTEVGPGWRYSGASVHCPICTGEFTYFLDADLQPIRGRRMRHYSDQLEPLDINEIAYG